MKLINLFPKLGYFYLISGDGIPANFVSIISNRFIKSRDTTLILNFACDIHHSQINDYLKLMWWNYQSRRVIATTQSYEIIKRCAQYFNTVEGKPFKYIRLKDWSESIKKHPNRNKRNFINGVIFTEKYTVAEVLSAVELNFEMR